MNMTPPCEPQAGHSSLAIRASALCKSFHDLRAVDGIDLEIRRGECFGLLGPNGAGKTTTVEMLEGLLSPDGGEIELLGLSWRGPGDEALKARIGVQLQETRFNEKLTVLEVLRLFCSFYPRSRPVKELMGMLELEEKAGAMVGKLSGGQRQRLALAGALAGDPELIFLDEPTTGLDPQVRRHIWSIVEGFKARGGTILLTTHYMEEAARLCDRVAIMDRGRIMEIGTPADLVAGLGAEQIIDITLTGPANADIWQGIHSLRPLSSRGEAGWRLAVGDMARGLMDLMKRLSDRGLGLLTLATHQASLEDVFIALTGRGLEE
jgi:ABC-2 type transport system ATP-binding protein